MRTPEEVVGKTAGANYSMNAESHFTQLIVADPSLADVARADGVDALLDPFGAATEAMVLLKPWRGGPSNLGNNESEFWQKKPEHTKRYLLATLTPSELTPTPQEARRQYPGVVLALKIKREQDRIKVLHRHTFASETTKTESVVLDRMLVEAHQNLARLRHEQRCR